MVRVEWVNLELDWSMYDHVFEDTPLEESFWYWKSSEQLTNDIIKAAGDIADVFLDDSYLDMTSDLVVSNKHFNPNTK